MSFGDSGSKQNHELCHQCLKPMMGTKIGKIQPAGFGQAERQGLIQACINFECFIGQKNLAK
ncbi:MAG: hypothetical protein A3D39_03565 [Candidatus Buchananbacteria bacterium RIFCSPHIGHO2_02_FULL_39_17]|nr:MAG: hypothetical protein A3D39_03565 [Candidatus Buchananbacteria bacterium RIFCSPHIGHO2_02_FULL_39_17]